MLVERNSAILALTRFRRTPNGDPEGWAGEGTVATHMVIRTGARGLAKKGRRDFSVSAAH